MQLTALLNGCPVSFYSRLQNIRSLLDLNR
jgi:hypothetical protein